VQNPVQCSAQGGANSGAATSRNGSHDLAENTISPCVPRAYAKRCEDLAKSCEISRRRAWESNPQPVARHLISSLQENSQTTGNTQDFEATGPKTGPRPNDPALDEIVSAWSSLPPELRQAILVLVRTAARGQYQVHPPCRSSRPLAPEGRQETHDQQATRPTFRLSAGAENQPLMGA
jgi:hypothetical protein